MTRYPRVKLGDVLERIERPVTVQPTEEYRFMGVRSFAAGCFDAGSKLGSETRYPILHRVGKSDFAYPKLMAWEGAFAVVPEEFDGWFVSPEFCIFRADGAKLDVRYLGYLFQRPQTWEDIAGSSIGTNLRRRRLYPGEFLAKEIPLPNLAEQRRIASKVDAVEPAAERLRRLITSAEQLSAAIPPAYAHTGWEPGHRGDARTETRLGHVMTEVHAEHEVMPNGVYPNVGVLSFGRGLFEKPPIDGATTRAKRLYRIRAGQFIYSRLFAFEGAYTIVPPRFDGYFVSNEFPTFELDTQRLLPDFLAAYFKSPSLWRELASGSKGLGLRRQRVHPDRLLAHRIHLPPRDHQTSVARVMERLRRLGESRMAQRARLDALVPAALNRAFAGEL